MLAVFLVVAALAGEPAAGGPVSGPAAASPGVQSAQPPAPPKAASLARRPRVLTWPDIPYPPDERAAGHQGDVIISVTVAADGSVSDVQVVTSSRAPALDQAVVAAARAATYAPGRGPDGQPAARPLQVKYEFAKDDLGNLNDKTCADFVADVRWFEQSYPEKTRYQMRLSNLLLAMFAMQAPPGGGAETVQRFNKAYDAAFDRCATHPRERFMVDLLRGR